MKKLMILCVSLLMLSACTERKAKQYSCVAFSVDCELEKDQILFMPIEFDSTTVDVFGKSLHRSNNDKYQWYLASTDVRVPVPMGVPVRRKSIRADDIPTYDYFPSPEKLTDKVLSQVGARVDTIYDSGIISGVSSLAVIVLGPNEIYNQGLTAQIALAE